MNASLMEEFCSEVPLKVVTRRLLKELSLDKQAVANYKLVSNIAFFGKGF